MSKWIQLWVKHPTADAVRVMHNIDPLLQRFGALPCAPPPAGIPIMEEDGTIEVRVFSEFALSMVKAFLKDNGFVIEREREND